MRCLIIDDNLDSREGYAEYLRSFGCDVGTLSSATTAIPEIRRWVPDVILLDLRMPELDGWEFLRLLRSDPVGRSTPTIVLSACAFPEDRDRAERAGCDAFLSKPCTPDEVLNCMTRVLSARSHKYNTTAAHG
jgi:two-component system, cell cycle response regulator DivK